MLYEYQKELNALPKMFNLTLNINHPVKRIKAFKLTEFFPFDSIIVSTATTSHSLNNFLEAYDIRHKNRIYIDPISRQIQSKFSLKNSIYTSGLKSLAELIKGIEKANSRLGIGDKIVIFDQFEKLFSYHDVQTVISFMDFLNNRTKLLRLNNIFIMDTNKLNGNLLNKINNISDKIIDL